MNYLDELSQLQTIAQEALKRKKDIIIENEELNKLKHPKFDYGRTLFEEYDEEFADNKFKIDSYFYSNLLKNLDESQQSQVQSFFDNYVDQIKRIYEYANFKPTNYKLNTVSILESNDYTILENTNRIINTYIKENWFNLDQTQREYKYLDKIGETAVKQILENNLPPEEAVKYGLKVSLVESLLHNINFPNFIKDKIEEDLIDTTYQKMFDQDKLKDMWENYLNNTKSLSQIVGVVI